jgi:hypothetical protein
VCSPASQTCELNSSDARGTDTTIAGTDAAGDGAAASTAVLVQHAKGNVLSGSTLTVALPALPSAGHLLVMIGGNPHGFLTSVAGGGVATWALATRSAVEANIEIWYGITDGSSANVTIQLTGATTPMRMSVSEWSGLIHGGNPLDGAKAVAGTSSPASSGTVTTTNSRDILVFGVGDIGATTFGTPTPGTWTSVDTVTDGVSQAVWWSETMTAGSYAPAVDESTHAWDAAVVALRIAP